MSDTPRPALLVVAGLASGGIAILQFALVIGGPPAHRLFGAPEELAAFAARDPMLAAIGPIVFAAIFGIFAAYAFSGAGLLRRLPWLLETLRLIAALYLLRGALVVLQLATLNQTDLSRYRDVAYSLCSLAIGLTYLFGARRAVGVRGVAGRPVR